MHVLVSKKDKYPLFAEKRNKKQYLQNHNYAKKS